MKQKHFFLYLVFLLFCKISNAQASVFTGTWKGAIENTDKDGKSYTLWKAKIKVTDKDKAELFLYDDKKQAYVSYLSDSRFAAQKKKVTFTSNSNTAALIISYEGGGNPDGISVYNMYYNSETKSVQILWSNNSKQILTDATYMLGFGDFVLDQPDSKTYTGNNLIVGGQSFNNISITSITKTKSKTTVVIKITNNTNGEYEGTFHKPGSPTAFYITNGDRSALYRLTGADNNLPYQFFLQPGESKTVSLYFEPVPDKEKLLNIFEGGDITATNLWKFFDVVLKD